MTTAIVTYGRGWPALAVARSLGRRGVRVVCGDSVRFAPTFFSKHTKDTFRYPDPADDEALFIEALEDVVRREVARGEGEVVLMPVHSETYVVARYKERFEALGAKLAIPSSEQIEATRDKGRLADLADDLGIRIPTTHRFRSMEEVYEGAPQVAYPAFVKIRGAAAGVGIEKVEHPEDLVRVVREFVDGYDLEPEDYPIVQEFCPGSDYCTSALFEHGRVVAVHTYRNVRQFPRTTGAGCLRETVRAEAAEAEAIRLLEHLGWHGLAQLDFRWEDAETPYLIELNPRFFGGLPQAIAAGVDHPAMMLQIALGQPVEPPVIDYDVRTETPVLGALATLDGVFRESDLRGRMRAIRDAFEREGQEGLWTRFRRMLSAIGREANPKDLASYLRAQLKEHKGTVSDVLSMDDPLPVLGLLFPLSVLLKHGTLSTAVVLSEARMKAQAFVPRGFRAHLKPSLTTLVATAAVFLLSVFCTSFWALDGSMVDRLFSAPAGWSAGLVPAGGAGAYAAFHVMNFAFLYGLAAFGLKVFDRARAAQWAPEAV